MFFRSKEVAYRMLDFYGFQIPENISNLPDEYVLGLMKPELLKCVDLGTLAAPLVVKMMDGMMSEMHAAFGSKKSISNLTQIEFSQAFSKHPHHFRYHKVFMNLRYSKSFDRDFYVLFPGSWEDEKEHWGSHPLLSTVPRKAYSVETVLQNINASVTQAPKVGDGHAGTWNRNFHMLRTLKIKIALIEQMDADAAARRGVASTQLEGERLIKAGLLPNTGDNKKDEYAVQI